ncbi:glycosyltransferase family 4 protein [Agromyces sp. H66]|uniref:glycosyltransferase family 4 protein n=1 Tax=Agromyces sp. H66 TaxID=2529859 RepID=UPI0020BFBE7F|nr:glycosyltransferase family 4 protein [Agromyces sp. H66]
MLVTRIFAPEAAAASFRLDALATALGSAVGPVTVLTAVAPPGLRTRFVPARKGVEVRRAPVLRDRSGYVRGYLQYLSFDVPAFFRLLFAGRADVVVVEPPPTTGLSVRVACGLRRIPYVYYAADIWSDATESTGAPALVARMVRWVERRALVGARAVIAVSDGVRDRVLELAPGAEVAVVTNGIDATVFAPDGERIEPAPWAVYAGTASEWQGADVFVRAMPAVLAQFPDARIAFIGQGSAWEALRALAERLAPHAVEFHDTLPPEIAARYLRSSRAGLVSLVPGQGYDFAIPTKIFATAAAGTPVIFAGVGPSRDVIARGGLGVAVDHDADAVAAAMIELFRAADDGGREMRAAWVAANASSASRARDAAEVVRRAAKGGRS